MCNLQTCCSYKTHNTEHSVTRGLNKIDRHCVSTYPSEIDYKLRKTTLCENIVIRIRRPTQKTRACGGLQNGRQYNQIDCINGEAHVNIQGKHFQNKYKY